MDCLILNADGNILSYFPLSIKGWKIAIKMKYEGKIDVLYEYDIKCRSQYLDWNLPAVAMLKKYKKPNTRVKFSKYSIYLRDNYKCAYCELDLKNCMEMASIDHIIPKSKGGKTTWTNVVTCCIDCNTKKSDRMDLLPKIIPKEPTIWEMIEKRKKQIIFVYHESWLQFLDWDKKLIVKKYKK
ncbi:MAG: HNH endonuclease [Candidatus Dojkabacteria bacterium]|nr:HNH endonuclease [Candidatus Dojkabacteria bacterium]